jgi:hypothetical protein
VEVGVEVELVLPLLCQVVLEDQEVEAVHKLEEQVEQEILRQ